jgi:hypothetical protein
MAIPVFDDSAVQAGFCDVFQNQNSGNWAGDILNAESATTDFPEIPEPSTVVFDVAGFSLLMLASRRGAARPNQNLRRSL